jgi:polyphosphate:AMP phosphotransferase
MSLPPRGRIGIFFGSWYTDVIVDRVVNRSSQSTLQRGAQDILAFERQLADDGALIVKLWFHLSKRQQKKRLRALERNKLTRWRVTKEDWKLFKLYDRFRVVSEQVLQDTSTGYAPWTLIDGEDHNYRSVTAAQTLLDALRGKISTERRKREVKRTKAPQVEPGELSVLDSLDMTKTSSKKRYEKRLELLQGRLFKLARDARAAGQSTLIVYEGWDAAGKGGNIRRLAQGMDARNYRVVPFAAPTDEERAHPYLWRFWRSLPRAGRVAIYDRSWYGRVLVERVEGFCSEADWRRAYAEINEFEEQLHRHGTIVIKFWLHIAKEEQLRRFKARDEDPLKRFKVDREDWANRRYYDAYQAAAAEMIRRTDAEDAKWTMVPADDKKQARLTVLKAVCETLER